MTYIHLVLNTQSGFVGLGMLCEDVLPIELLRRRPRGPRGSDGERDLAIEHVGECCGWETAELEDDELHTKFSRVEFAVHLPRGAALVLRVAGSNRGSGLTDLREHGATLGLRYAVQRGRLTVRGRRFHPSTLM